MSSRLETIGRGVLVIGILVGLGALGVIFGRGIFETPREAPALQNLTPLLTRADVVSEQERDDLSQDRGGRTVLLSVPEADNEDAAVRSMLLLLRAARWFVTGRGGAVSPDGSVCLALSTPEFWLEDRANAELRAPVSAALREADHPGVVVDMFFCSDEQPE